MKGYFNETQLLEPSAKAYIEAIKELRNLSAHPILDSEDLLATPNKDTVRAAIRNALEYVLLKPAIYSKKIATEFMDKVPNNSGLIFGNEEQYETYLRNRYFKYFNDEIVKKIFYFLWIAVYRSQDEEAKEFREEYFITLEKFYKNYKVLIDDYYRAEHRKFDNIDIQDKWQLKYYVTFFANTPHLYKFVDESNKATIEHKIEENLDIYSLALFINKDFETHFKEVKNKFVSRNKIPVNRQFLFERAKEEGILKELFNFYIDLFSTGKSYADCQTRWEQLIKNSIENFFEANLNYLLLRMNSNNSIYNAYWLDEKYLSKVEEVLKNKEIEIDWAKYPKYKFCFLS